MKRPELKSILQNAYNREQWIRALQFLSGNRNLLNIHLSPKEVNIHTQEADRLIKNFVQLGLLKTSDGTSLPLYEIILENDIRIEYNRVGVNEFIKRFILKDAVKGALVTFSYEETVIKSEWRFSFISKNSASDFFAEAEAEETTPKKYTYIFGTSEEHRTAIERLYNLEQSRFRLEDFFEAFNVEPVSKKFFDEYKQLYKDFSEYIFSDKEAFAVFENENGDRKQQEKDVENFVKRLLGRIVFLYFLQKKRWIGASSTDYNDGNTNFLSDLFHSDKDAQSNFYSNYLSPLFFNALNTPNRKNDQFKLYNGQVINIPFLNGGLFEVEQEPDRHTEIKFPVYLFNDLFNFFGGYNFTIYENSPEEHTVAVDPEMLGHIFENLIDYNKDTGTFYTPKEIVHYMTQESLIEFLITNTAKERIQIESLVKNHSTENFSDTELKKIESLVDGVKICDPAIGSGAFPMGLLQEIFALKEIIHYKIGTGDWKPAEVKQNIIQNSIYGVDLDEGAVEIARLRFWLSLVVDEELPKPLPNLDYKIMQGNSVVESYNGIDLSKITSGNDLQIAQMQIDLFGNYVQDQMEITVGKSGLADEIQKLIKKYFTAKAEKKKEIKNTIQNKIVEHIDFNLELRENQLHRQIGELENVKTLNNSQKKNLAKFKEDLLKLNATRAELYELQKQDSKPYFLWHLFFADVFAQGGFDIVIGNPPYIKEYVNRAAFNEFRNGKYYMGKMDLWYGFACMGLDWLKEGGIECFIAQNNWITSAGAAILRNEVLTRSEIKRFIDFGDYKVFQSAGIQTMIYLIQKKQKPAENYEVLYAGLLESNINKNQLNIFLDNNKNDEDYYEKYAQHFLPDNYLLQFISFTESSKKSLANSVKEKSNYKLDKKFVAQGIVAPQDKLNKKASEILGEGYKVNQGVFVLNSDEIGNYDFSEEEQNLIKPFYTTDNFKKYVTHQKNSEWIIYTSSGINNQIENYPAIKRHLDKFSEIITSDFKPYGLHRSRDPFFFEGEKIVSVRKCIEPTFTYNDDSCYVAQTFFVIKPQNINLKYLTTFLNSKIVYYWLKNEGKMQGNNFQVDKEPLLNIPVYKPTDYSPFLELFELISFASQYKDNIVDGIQNEHIANFIQEIIDACFFDIYFPEETKSKNLSVTQEILNLLKDLGITSEFGKLPDSYKANKLQNFYNKTSSSQSPVRNKIRSFSLLSPDLLGVILNS